MVGTAMTRPPLRSVAVACLAAAIAACASAGKRLEQGMEAEASGSFYAASIRYIEALEKDADLVEARERLMEAGDSAITIGLARAEVDIQAGDPVPAAEEYLAIDRLVGRARAVGVRLPTPADYADLRRSVFDGAIDALMERAVAAGDRGEWGQARSAYDRIRRDFAPSAEQRADSEEAEAALLVAWAEEEASYERFRRAYDLADEALGSPGALPADLADQATDLQARALAAGTRVLAVFPVTATTAVMDAAGSDVTQQLSDLLELEHWRLPPLFVVVADPVMVRQASRRYNVVGGRFRAGPVLDDVGADFGALVELVRIDGTEQNLRTRVQTVRTRDGRTTNYTEESGDLTLVLEARVAILDQRGSQVTSFSSRASDSGSFERGRYRGDPGELELSRGERRLFDPVIQRQMVADIEARATEELAARVADRVFSEVLSRIR
jgi:tetratricopeptide (TPR) repeat protein